LQDAIATSAAAAGGGSLDGIDICLLHPSLREDSLSSAWRSTLLDDRLPPN